MRISDWSSDVCSSDLILDRAATTEERDRHLAALQAGTSREAVAGEIFGSVESRQRRVAALYQRFLARQPDPGGRDYWVDYIANGRDIELALYLAASDEYLRRSAERYPNGQPKEPGVPCAPRSEEPKTEIQSLMRTH